jgi:hypothetical protein
MKSIFRACMDRDGKAVTEDCKDVAALDSNIQVGAGLSSGKFCKSFGDPRKLTTSNHVEDGGDEYFIRVGTIGCSAFRYKCSFGLA